MEKIRRSYYSVIPADVRYSKKIVDGAKLLYSEITALCGERGYCWASNDYFAELYNNDKRTISRWLTSLSKENFIYTDLTGKRKIFLRKEFAFDVEGNHIMQDEEFGEDINVPSKSASDINVATKKKKAKPVKKVLPKKYTDNDLQFAEILFQKIIYNFPTFENKKVNISEWAEEIRKLREIDKASEQQIRFMITWVQGGEIETAGKPPRKFEPHDFWARNILSAHKLRKQWHENLVPQLQTSLMKTAKRETVAQL